LQGFCERLRVPKKFRELAELVASYQDRVAQALDATPEHVWQLLHDTDAMRRQARFEDFLLTSKATGFAQGLPVALLDRAFAYLRAAINAIAAIDAGRLVADETDPQRRQMRVRQAAIEAILGLPVP
jgi:tRNA nucleotidyltransferase (CCA-adding enzyme)